MDDLAAGIREIRCQATELPRGVYQIPLPTPLPVGTVNAYLLMGDVPTLIDPGPCSTEALSALQEGVRQIGIDLTDIWQVIITHHHVDHSGLARSVAELSGARIIAHGDAVDVLADPSGAVHRTVRFLRTWGERQGIPHDVLGQLAWGYIRWAGLSRPATVDETLHGGEAIMAGSDFWQVLHTPGHGSGHICLYREEDGTIISGDHLLPKTVSSTLIEPSRDSSTDRVRSGLDYLAALSRLALLRLGTVLPGHGNIFDGVSPAFILSRIELVRRRAEEACQLLEGGPMTVWQLCQALFPRVKSEMMIFAISNVAGYLDLLSANGRIAETNDEGIVRFVSLEAMSSLSYSHS